MTAMVTIKITGITPTTRRLYRRLRKIGYSREEIAWTVAGGISDRLVICMVAGALDVRRAIRDAESAVNG